MTKTMATTSGQPAAAEYLEWLAGRAHAFALAVHHQTRAESGRILADAAHRTPPDGVDFLAAWSTVLAAAMRPRLDAEQLWGWTRPFALRAVHTPRGAAA